MTHDEYIKRRDEILPDYDDDNACICYKDCAHPKDKTAAQQAIDALVLAVIGEDEVHTEKCKAYTNIMQIDKFCICNARLRNIFIINQRQIVLGNKEGKNHE